MRLQLTSLVALLLACTDALAAETTADARVSLYSDEELTVVNQSNAASVQTPEGLRASGHFGVDVISGATRAFLPDAITSATRIDETRLEGSVSLGGVPMAGLRLDGGYLTSKEPDFWSHETSLTAVTELFDRRGTLSVTGALGFLSVGRAGDPTFSEEEGYGRLDASYSHALGRATSLTGRASLEQSLCGERRGCDASPYRYVPIALHEDGPFIALTERHPATRTRGAFAARLSQNLRPGLALHGGYRLYTDSWGVVGHTSDAALAHTFFGERLGLRLDARAYLQGPAAFHGHYVLQGGAAPGYRTADRRLGNMHDLSLGGAGNVDLPAIGPLRLRAQVRVAHVWYRYDDDLIAARDAWVAGLGMGATF